MAYLYVRHTVSDFNKWFRVYNSHKEDREKYGIINIHLFRSQNDQNDIIMIYKISDMQKARDFMSAPETDLAREASSVIGEPETIILEDIVV